jgi:glycosyltransferase involved in cell wall biosynthesis
VKQLRVIHFMDSAGIFGAEVMLLTLTKAQQESGLAPLIGSIQPPADVERNANLLSVYARNLGIATEAVTMQEKSLFGGLRALRKFVNNHPADIIHSHGFKANILLACLKFFMKLPPVVTTIHGWTGANSDSRIALYEVIDRWCLQRLDHVVVVTPEQKNHTGIKRLAASRTSCILNGTDLDWRNELTISESERRKLDALKDFAAGNRLVVAIGRLSKEKGHLYLLKAFAVLAEKDTTLRLVIAGEGPLRPVMEQTIHDLALEQKVCLPGYLERVDKLLDQAECLAQPSTTEGLPITLLEAMGRSIPIVASAVGGMPELLEHGKLGYLAPPNDPEGLQEALLFCLNNQLYTSKKTAAARVRFDRDYSSAQMAEQYQSIYEACMGKLPQKSANHG